ncbi:MAG: calcium/sodium antiporter [Candidatus Bathyarchaeota archaeon]|nr:calcium/sodium antiporter [Candidatus Bathyarchaeota archaeon]MDH5495610.1 calcium/sodium antiporter [Candidatus Bathyarchaeota archaeon]
MIQSIVFLLLGIVVLFLGSQLAIRGFENIAHRFRVSHLFIGLTVVAIGTSLPEIGVSVIGAIDILAGLDMSAVSGVVVGNKIGSFLNQLTIIMGIVGLTGMMAITKRELKREGTMLVLSIILFSLVALDLKITPMEGGIVTLAYLLYFIYLVKQESLCKSTSKVQEEKPKIHLVKDLLLILVGMCALLVAAEFVVEGSVQLAEILSIPTSVTGLLIVGLGTGLPELTLDITALRRGSAGIAVGDMIGSNICDILFSLGAGAMISGFTVEPILLLFDTPFMFFVAFLVIGLFLRNMRLERKEALVLVLVYVSYVLLKLAFFMGG